MAPVLVIYVREKYHSVHSPLQLATPACNIILFRRCSFAYGVVTTNVQPVATVGSTATAGRVVDQQQQQRQTITNTKSYCLLYFMRKPAPSAAAATQLPSTKHGTGMNV
jgi:hypothetical protein